MLMNRLNIFWLRYWSPQRLLTAGILLQFASALALLLLALSPHFKLPVVLPLLMIYVGSLGLITANTMGTVMQYFREVAGSATALMGVIQFSGGALAGLLWGKLHDHTPVPMMEVSLLTASLALVFLLFARKASQSEASQSGIHASATD